MQQQRATNSRQRLDFASVVISVVLLVRSSGNPTRGIMRGPNCFLGSFLFFFGKHFSEFGKVSLSQSPRHFFGNSPPLRSDPIGHVGSGASGLTCVGQQRSKVEFLTKVSRTSSVTTREVSQNGIWIRVMCNMESFERPQETCQVTA